MVYQGMKASKGEVTGTARVMFYPDGEIGEDEILVTGMTTPDFVPAMRRCAGIVTQKGGRTCHAAIVARELGKPCVVGLAEALELDGVTIRVDGSTGTVEVL
jgi:pyruvate,water dikinase